MTMPASNPIHAALYEIRCELARAARNMSFLLPTVFTPLAFYAVFVVGMKVVSGNGAIQMLVTYSVFCAMAPGLFGVGTSVSQERAIGWAALRRASPLRPGVLLLSKMTLALFYCTAAAGLLVLFAVLVVHVKMSLLAWVLLSLVVLLTGVFFALLGLLFGLIAEQGALAALCNLFFLPLAVLGGLWFPIQALHPLLQQIANLLPTYHLAQLALIATNLASPDDVFVHIAAAAAWILVVLSACALALHRTSSQYARGM